jgi:3-hydroxy-9,10-secoandrosta-1,3,5(10)-triene-9,17-dione monooxygenase reductase component
LSTVTGERFRQVLSHVPTSVAIVAGLVGDRPAGLSVGTFVPVSLEPPLVGFFVARSSTSWPEISRAGSFCVSVLGAGQAGVSAQLAVTGADKFDGISWEPAPSGHPVIAGAVAWVDCTVEGQQPAGDHVFVLGRVADLAVGTGSTPLLHHRGGYRRAEDLDPATEPPPDGRAAPDRASGNRP